ncbi:MAG: thioredoxin domain-containing protein, partial [Bacteroidota bacterium]
MKTSGHFILLIFLTLAACKSPVPPSSQSQTSKTEGSMNHLAGQSSPYLLQHAYNPVDWYPWGPEALQKAKEENKMLIISVGYAACHWCHVMEHESFEDTTVSQIMNEYFVAIKVDREERPDIDDVYMTACQLATEKGCGWPLNAFALPDGRPVWAGTYFPKKKWIEILQYFRGEYAKAPDKMAEYAEQLTKGIQSQGLIPSGDEQQAFSREELDKINKNFLQRIDFQEGGRKGAPKFPMPNNYQFLLAYHHFSGNKKALEAVTTTLDKMAWGGIYDHLGGGFARYSTDAVWKAPHFEKMLYDNGQLVSLYADAYRLTQKPLYKSVVEQSLSFVERELSDENGGFYSSLDADSEGEEGKFYVWTKEEVAAHIDDPNELALYCAYYEIKDGGNWEHDKNILHRKRSLAQLTKKYKLSEEAILQTVQSINDRLLEARTKRIRPGLDDKILTSWNALMLKGYVDAYKALGNKAYLDRALKNAHFLKQNALQKGGRLNRNYKDGQSVINAFLDDYALLADALTSLYEVTFDEEWLFLADRLVQYVLEHFKDGESAFFFYTSKLDPPLVARKMETSDNVISGSNSTMARVLFKLGTLLYQPDYVESAERMLKQMQPSQRIAPQPNFYANWC